MQVKIKEIIYASQRDSAQAKCEEVGDTWPMKRAILEYLSR